MESAADDGSSQWQAHIECLLQAMQTQQHIQACERLLAMTPEELGAAAVDGARMQARDRAGEPPA